MHYKSVHQLFQQPEHGCILNICEEDVRKTNICNQLRKINGRIKETGKLV